MAFKITPLKIEETFNPSMIDFCGSTQVEAGKSDVCSFNVDAADNNLIILISNQTYTGGCDIEVEFAKGDFWAAKKISGDDLTVYQGMIAAYVVDTAVIKSFDGEISIKLTPSNSSKTLATLGVGVAVLEIIRSANN